MVRNSRKAVLLLALCVVCGINDSAFAQSELQLRVYRARDKALPALVHIQPVISDYRTGKLQKQSVVGSGVIIHPDGYVVTNYHVAGKADHILCTMYNREQVKAELIGGDPSTDLAVIKLDLSEYTGTLSPPEFGNSDSLQVGQYVIAMGSPLALARTITFGVISTLNRYFPDDTRLPSGELTGQYNLWIQTDAAINPGNSGGPLVDLNGRVVGINSRATLFANNIGFSIPSNIVRRVTSQLIESGKVVRSWIGIHCQPLQELEGWFGSENEEGVLIASVDSDSPAQQSKLRAGDIIQAINGQPVSARFEEEIPAVYSAIADYSPGTELDLTVKRRSEVFHVYVTTSELGELQGRDVESAAWGCAVKAITQQMALEYQLPSTDGVFVTGVRHAGPAFTGGLRSGDVITQVDGNSISDLGDYTQAYQERSESNTPVMLNVRRGNATRFVLIKPESPNADSSASESAP